jgi:sporulation protein YlmC with PRC-barrel domain
MGKPVIVRDTAEQLGDVRCFAIDGTARRVTAVVVADGRRSRVVDWEQVSSVGPDAVIVEGSREPSSDDERTASCATSAIEKRVLSDRGNELGTSVDVEIDDDGTVRELVVGDTRIVGDRLRGVGSYAVVVEADPSEA